MTPPRRRSGARGEAGAPSPTRARSAPPPPPLGGTRIASTGARRRLGTRFAPRSWRSASSCCSASSGTAPGSSRGTTASSAWRPPRSSVACRPRSPRRSPSRFDSTPPTPARRRSRPASTRSPRAVWSARSRGCPRDRVGRRSARAATRTPDASGCIPTSRVSWRRASASASSPDRRRCPCSPSSSSRPRSLRAREFSTCAQPRATRPCSCWRWSPRRASTGARPASSWRTTRIRGEWIPFVRPSRDTRDETRRWNPSS